MSSECNFITISLDLDQAGLIWHPEIGDEVSDRSTLERISILVDPQGLTPSELRINYVWLPTTEQLIEQFEAREALIYHAGMNDELGYEAVIRTKFGVIETSSTTLRNAFGEALQMLLTDSANGVIH